MNHMQRREQLRGIALTIIGGIFWGLAGVCGQYLFEERGLTAKWLVSVRLVLAGLILLLTVWAKQKKQMFEIWREKRDVFQLIMFGIFGMAFCQLSYYVAVETSNAGTATVLQYTAPIIIMLYVSVRNKKVPQRIEMLALVLAVGGTFLLATHGNPGTLVISKEGLFWGLSSAVALVLYTMLPGNLISRYGSTVIVGFGMMIGGIFLFFVFGYWNYKIAFHLPLVLGVGAIVLIGTALAFTLYLQGVSDIGSVKASMIACVEPVSATIISALWLKTKFTGIDIVGLIAILTAVLLLSKKDNSRVKTLSVE